MDEDQAAELLLSAAADERAGREAPLSSVSPDRAPVESNLPNDQIPASGDDEGATAQDTFSRIDPNDLPPELLPVYRSMQADYTRKTQEISEQRRAMEGLDPVEARGALDFIQALNSDPDVALAVHAELSRALEQSGLTPAQASQEAARQVQEVQAQDDEWDTPRGPAPVDPAILQRLENAESFMQRQYQEQEQARYEAELERTEMQIRNQYPEWNDEDLNSVYAFAFANGGDLHAAADQYVQEQSRLAARWMTSKGQAPGAAPYQGGIAHDPGEAPKTLRDATDAAIERFRNAFTD